MEERGKQILESLKVHEEETDIILDNDKVICKCSVAYRGQLFTGEYEKYPGEEVDNYGRFFELVFNNTYDPNEESDTFASLFTDEEMDAITAYYQSTEEFQEEVEDFYYNRGIEED